MAGYPAPSTLTHIWHASVGHSADDANVMKRPSTRVVTSQSSWAGPFSYHSRCCWLWFWLRLRKLQQLNFLFVHSPLYHFLFGPFGAETPRVAYWNIERVWIWMIKMNNEICICWAQLRYSATTTNDEARAIVSKRHATDCLFVYI